MPYDVNDIHEKIISSRHKHKAGKLVEGDLLGGLEEKARQEAEKIKEVAERHGFAAVEAHSPDGHIDKIIIGNLHFKQGNPNYLQDQPFIVSMIKDMINKGILNPGDQYCFEGPMRGVVDYEVSRAEPGNNVVAIRSRKKVYGWEVDDKQHVAGLLEILKENKLLAVCNDLPEYGDRYNSLLTKAGTLKEKGKRLFAKSKRLIDEGKTAESAEVTAECTQILVEATQVMDKAHKYLVRRIKEGFADHLKRFCGRSVQVFGVTDVFTGIVQDTLKKSNGSYVVLVPANPKY